MERYTQGRVHLTTCQHPEAPTDWMWPDSCSSEKKTQGFRARGGRRSDHARVGPDVRHAYCARTAPSQSCQQARRRSTCRRTPAKRGLEPVLELRGGAARTRRARSHACHAVGRWAHLGVRGTQRFLLRLALRLLHLRTRPRAPAKSELHALGRPCAAFAENEFVFSFVPRRCQDWCCGRGTFSISRAFLLASSCFLNPAAKSMPPDGLAAALAAATRSLTCARAVRSGGVAKGGTRSLF